MFPLSHIPYFMLLSMTVILSAKISMVNSHGCESFDNVRSEVIETNGRQSSEKLDGCIERKKLHDKTIVSAYFRNQKIPKLGKESVRYLVKLKTISFWGCNVETVEAGAFKGVPQLKNVQISFSNLKKIRMGVFNPIETLELLRIHDNRIDTIDDQAFANLTSLKKIYAGNNALSYWHSNWFRNSTNLQTMDFHNNKIRTLPRRAFATLPKLKRINLDWNEISAIESEAFRGLKKLQYLGLGNNRLTVIHESVFPSSIEISTLLINANYLNYLSGELLNKVSVLEVFLDYNPWKCPCLKEIYAWIHSTNGALRVYDGCGSNHVPVCANRKSVLQCSENVDEELSRRYLGVFANLTKPLASGCVRTN